MSITPVDLSIKTLDFPCYAGLPDVEVEPVRSFKIQTVPIFKEGLEQYCQGNFANAKVCFEQIVPLNPDDKPSQLYL
ncbi:hypothetical protein QUA56_14995 [Microcoleus sp. N3A4]|uniref:hypothetical protein n=1 Tax=Microcoleus sp. N3A4 TaxID=3055379 RepID=UPI002FCF211F